MRLSSMRKDLTAFKIYRTAGMLFRHVVRSFSRSLVGSPDLLHRYLLLLAFRLFLYSSSCRAFLLVDPIFLLSLLTSSCHSCGFVGCGCGSIGSYAFLGFFRWPHFPASGLDSCCFRSGRVWVSTVCCQVGTVGIWMGLS